MMRSFAGFIDAHCSQACVVVLRVATLFFCSVNLSSHPMSLSSEALQYAYSSSSFQSFHNSKRSFDQNCNNVGNYSFKSETVHISSFDYTQFLFSEWALPTNIPPSKRCLCEEVIRCPSPST